MCPFCIVWPASLTNDYLCGKCRKSRWIYHKSRKCHGWDPVRENCLLWTSHSLQYVYTVLLHCIALLCCHSVAYLGGPWCDAPPLARPWKFFTDYFIWKNAFFAVFQQISEKMGEFAASIERSKAKCFSFRGAKPPWLPDQELCPWTPLGAPPPDLRYRLALCTLAMPPPCQILNTPLLSLYCYTSIFSIASRGFFL